MTRAGWHTRSGAVVIGNASAMRAHNNAIAARLKEAEQALACDQLDKALASAQALLRREPGNGRAHLIAGICAQRQKSLDMAERHFRRALTSDPDNVDAAYGLAMVLSEQRQFTAALPYIERVVAADADDARYQFRLGLILDGVGRREASRRALERSIELDPHQSLSRNALANYLRERGELAEALSQYEAAVGLDPMEPSIYGNAAVSLQELGDIRASVRLGRQSLALNPFNLVFFSNLLLALNYAHDISRAELDRAHRQYGRLVRHIEPPVDAGLWQSRERLRVGLISPDLRQHPVAAFVEPLLSVAHDVGIDLYCYGDSPVVDTVTQRLSQYPVTWRQVASLDGPALSRLISRDSLDVLLDLAGHTGSNRRLIVFNGRLAPLQGTWLGYTFSTGVDGIDVRLTDAVADPEGLDDELYRETLLRLPAPFVNFRIPDVTPVQGPRAAGPVRFVCLNNVAKMSEPMLHAWARILARVPDATLTLKSRLFADPETTQRVSARIAASGIDTARLRLDATLTSFEAHLRYYDAADIALDTFPYNGTTTTCEALWMGVPVVTLRGRLHAGRVGASLLSAVGVDGQLVTESIDEYVERAVALASDLAATRALREQITERVRRSKLIDARVFASRLKQSLTQELHARQSRKSAKARRVPEYCFIAGMPRSGSTWVFNVARDMFAMKGRVVSLGFVDEHDELEPHADGDAVHVAKLHHPNASVAAMLARGEAMALFSERSLPDVLVSLAQFQGVPLQRVCEASYIDPVIEARSFWRAQPNTRRVAFDAITERPHDLIHELSHWFGLGLAHTDIDTLVERWSADAVRRELGKPEMQNKPRRSYDPSTLLHPRHLVGNANKNYRALLGPATYAAVCAAVAAREHARGDLFALAQSVPSVPVRIGPSRQHGYHADVWMQLPPDVREASTFIALEQGDWFECELGFMRRFLEPGMRMLDVGANHGVYALSAAQAVGVDGQVWAVEPGGEPAARLLRASLLPIGAPVEVLQAALGATDSRAQLATGEASELRRVVHGAAYEGESEDIEVLRLDTIVQTHALDSCDYIKLDVEGDEAAVIAGAQSFLERASPLVQFEIRSGNSQSLDALHALQALDYDGYQVVPGLNVLRPFRHDADAYCLNLIAMTPTRAEQLRGRGLLFDDQQAPRLGRSTCTFEDLIEKWPYAKAFESKWRANIKRISNETGDVLEGMSWFVEAHTPQASPAHAYKALERAAECFRLACDTYPQQRLSLAAALLALGQRERAIAALRSLVAQLPGVPDPAAQPFVCPVNEYCHMRPGQDVPMLDWMDALIRASYVRASCHSALYMAGQTHTLLAGAANPAAMDARSRRTLILLDALNDTAAPGPLVNAWPVQVLKQFRNLPDWLVN